MSESFREKMSKWVAGLNVENMPFMEIKSPKAPAGDWEKPEDEASAGETENVDTKKIEQ